MTFLEPYSAGDTVESTLTFASYSKKPVLEVVAAFSRYTGEDDDRTFEDKDATEKLWLKGTPEEQASTEDAVYWRVVLSAPLVIANEQGRYRCDWVEATYLGAQKVEFQPTLDARFEIRHENILNPRGTEWTWGATSR